jgi:hypothetical protein
MFLAELNIEGNVAGRGKAANKEDAVHLAAMHAELTIDYLGHALFPADAAAQLEHARLVKGIGRWATSSDGAERPTEDPRHAPLALKQHVGAGGEAEGLGGFARGRAAARSIPERIVMLHNELSNPAYDNALAFAEICPEDAVCKTARRLLEAWQRRQGNHYPELYVTLRMGDIVRATVVLPLPGEFGVRGGNAVGRTAEQAIEMACMHAIDVLAALGFPVLADRDEQLAMNAARRAQGLSACADDGALRDPNMLSPPGLYIEGATPRPLPREEDVNAALAVTYAMYQDIRGSTEDIVTKGNLLKPQVMAYNRFRYGRDVAPTVIQTGSTPTVRNVVYLPLLLPAHLGGKRLLAIGSGLKKKDADRSCFLHAAALLDAYGVDTAKEKLREEALDRDRRQAARLQLRAEKVARDKAIREGASREAMEAAVAAARPAAPQTQNTPRAGRGAGGAPTASADAAVGGTDAVAASAAPETAPTAAESAAVESPAAAAEALPVMVPRPMMHPLLRVLLDREDEALLLKQNTPNPY